QIKSKDINVDKILGFSTRRTYFRYFYQEQPNPEYMTQMGLGRGLFIVPDAQWTAEDFFNKLDQNFGQAQAEAIEQANNIAVREAEQNQELLKDNLEKMFRKKYPNKDFNYEKELEKYLNCDTQKFKKEYQMD
ncbi:hypothetical protein IMG5_080460, partial [Ichthyophthirius multifiliis]